MPPPDSKGALADALLAALRQDSATSERTTLVLIRDLLELVHDAVGSALEEAKVVLDSQKVDPSSLRSVPSASSIVDPSSLLVLPAPSPTAGPSRVRRVVSKATIDSADEADAEDVFGDGEEVELVEPEAIGGGDHVEGDGDEGDGDEVVDAEGEVEEVE